MFLGNFIFAVSHSKIHLAGAIVLEIHLAVAMVLEKKSLLKILVFVILKF